MEAHVAALCSHYSEGFSVLARPLSPSGGIELDIPTTLSESNPFVVPVGYSSDTFLIMSVVLSS